MRHEDECVFFFNVFVMSRAPPVRDDGAIIISAVPTRTGFFFSCECVRWMRDCHTKKLLCVGSDQIPSPPEHTTTRVIRSQREREERRERERGEDE